MNRRVLSMALSLAPLLFAGDAQQASAAVFINEIHYDDSTGSGDVGERVEVVATNGETLTDYRIVLYNGSGGAAYDTDAVPVGDLRSCGGTVRVGFVSYPTNGLQNGGPDGLALVGPGDTVVQFLSYEGVFAATGGPANGMTSVDIGVAETNATAPGTSLQLGGTGASYADFTWQPSSTETFGSCNTGQTFAAGADVPPGLSSSDPVSGATNVAIDRAFSVTFTEPVTASPGAFALSCGMSQTLTVSGGPIAYTLTPAAPLPFDSACTMTIVATAITDQDGTADAMGADVTVGFTTAPDLAPTIQRTSPAGGDVGVPRTANLTVTFTEPVAVTPPLATLSCSLSGTVALVQSGGPLTWTLDPAAELQPVETCTFTVRAASVTDLDGAPNGLASDGVVTFTTSGGAGTYYDSVDASSCDALRTTLHAVIDDHAFFPYTSSSADTWDILDQADQDPLDQARIVDVYRNASYPKAGGGNANYNREHTWPNSYGYNDRTGDHAYTDTHMLYLSNSTYNTLRSNIPYGDCPAMTGCSVLATDAYAGRGGGPQVYPGEHNWYSTTTDTFEVWAGRKGDVARAVLYMDIRYEGGIHGITGQTEPDLVLTDTRALIQTTAAGVFANFGYMGLKSELLAWHAADPPDANEQLRNDLVATFQGNRNPFIDRPEWAECLFTCNCSASPPARIFGSGFEQGAVGR